MSTQPLEIEPPTLDELRSDLGRYSAECLTIRTKQALTANLTFNRAQTIVHEKLGRQMRETGRVRAIILKARQEGISTYTAARFYRRVNLYENQVSLVIGDQRKRSQVLFAIYELFDKRLPDWLRPHKRASRRGGELHYDTMDGTGLNSKLIVETAMDVVAGRGMTLQAVHASELAFWENPEQVWTSLMQAVPDRGSEVIIESTANGVGNMFHQMWEDAEAGDSSFIPIFLPWWIHEEYVTEIQTDRQRKEIMDNLTAWETRAMLEGFELEGDTHRLTLEQVAWRRATIRDKLRGDETLFKQEYPSTAREAFLVSGNCYFDEDALEILDRKTRRPERFKLVTRGRTVFRYPSPRGELRVWHQPDPDGQYVIFADTATGKASVKGRADSIYTGEREQGGRDFSAAWVYEVNERRFVALLHGRIPPENFAARLYELGHLYCHRGRVRDVFRPALIGVERNHSSGETVVKVLKEELKYPNLYHDWQLNKRLNKRTQAVGFITTEAKRTVMLDDFGAWLRDAASETIGDEVFSDLPDPDTIRECFTFVRDDSGKPNAQEGCHDDRVIAASGALLMSRHHHPPTVSSRRERVLVRRGGAVGHLVEEEA